MALPARPRRGPRRQCAGVTLIEFALVSPVLFVLVMGIVVGGLVVTNELQLGNVVREGARAAALCGGIGRAATALLPDGGQCTNAALVSFIASSLHAVPGTVALNITVINGNSIPNDPNVLDECQKGKTVVVDASFAQPLYVPLVGSVLGDGGGTLVRTLHASAVATCEQ
jgi:Flp pilus assembly protein TadG